MVPIDEEMINYVISGSVTSAQAESLTFTMISEEIKAAMFNLSRHKGPGPDGYTTEFFLSSRDTVGNKVIAAVNDFFEHGQLQEANTIIISMVPKKVNPTTLSDFRPISCCNTVYKYITRILVSRIKEVLHGLIGSEQPTFIPGRRIVDNILLAIKLIMGYHTQNSPSWCAMKIVIRKAYDSVQ